MAIANVPRAAGVARMSPGAGLCGTPTTFPGTNRRPDPGKPLDEVNVIWVPIVENNGVIGKLEPCQSVFMLSSVSSQSAKSSSATVCS